MPATRRSMRCYVDSRSGTFAIHTGIEVHVHQEQIGIVAGILSGKRGKLKTLTKKVL